MIVLVNPKKWSQCFLTLKLNANKIGIGQLCKILTVCDSMYNFFLKLVPYLMPVTRIYSTVFSWHWLQWLFGCFHLVKSKPLKFSVLFFPALLTILNLFWTGWKRMSYSVIPILLLFTYLLDLTPFQDCVLNWHLAHFCSALHPSSTWAEVSQVN